MKKRRRSAGERIYFLREFSVPLLAGVSCGFAWANLAPERYHRAVTEKIAGTASLEFFTNDLFMVFFFGMAAVEIVRSCLPGGPLYPIRKAVNPLLATAGGVLGPASIYLGINHLFGSPALTHGWGIPTATDIALAWLVARVVFGPGHPAVSFLLLLAVADDGIGLAIIALFYPDPAHPVVLGWLLLVAAAMGASFLLRRAGVRSYWAYLLVGGVPSWFGLFLSHLHPALALVFVTPFLPHARRGEPDLFEGDPRDVSPLSRFEHDWKVVVDFGMFLFGLVNAGVPLSTVGFPTWLVLISLFFGKTAGITLFALFAGAIGFPLPARMGKKELILAATIAGIGLTVSLFIAGEAFVDPATRGAAKMGALFSGGIAPLAITLGALLRVKKGGK